MNAFKSQQHRWAKGSIQTCRKLLPQILRAKIPFSVNRSGRFEELGARIDARAVLRSNGAALDDSLHTTPAIGASLYVRF